MESPSWFSSLTEKISNVYKKAKDAVSPKTENTQPLATGGAKRRNKKKKTKRVRFSKRNKVYRYRTMRKK
jgi:hypothetical protein